MAATMNISDACNYLIQLSISRGYKLISFTETLDLFETAMTEDGISFEERMIIDHTLKIAGSYNIDVELFLRMLNIKSFDSSKDLRRMLSTMGSLPEDYKYCDDDNGKIINGICGSTLVSKEDKRIVYKIDKISMLSMLYRINKNDDKYSGYFANHESLSLEYSRYQVKFRRMQKNKENDKIFIDSDETYKLKKTIKDLEDDLYEQSKTVALSKRELEMPEENLTKIKVDNKVLLEEYNDLNIDIATIEKRINKKREILKKLKDYYYSQTA